ncbi:MAG: enoyl-CoA hydratase/isomerase family protein [Tepidiformaceae bacterium]
MQNDLVLFERPVDHVALITINRPEKRNSMSEHTRRAMIDAWLKFKDDPDLWVAILTGAGDLAFSAGNDLREISTGLPDDDWQAPVRDSHTVAMAAMRGLEIKKPVIAAVNGYCFGAAFAVALACDVRLCSPNATFGCTEVKFSHMAGGGQATRLARFIPMGPAMELALTGEAVDADTALRWGLVNRVVPQAQLVPEALELAKRMCIAGPDLLSETKDFMYQSQGLSLENALYIEGIYYDRIRNSPRYEQGTKQFVKNRDAHVPSTSI